MIGAFLALDLFVFYVFWELMLIPMYFIIGIWGGERRLYAAIKFVIYTLVGSLLMLVAILYLYVAVARGDRAAGRFDYTQLSHLTLPRDAAAALLRRLRAGLRHQGADLPAAHLVARRARRGADRRLGDPGRVLLKFGTYGFLRFALPMFPLAADAGRAADRDRWR